MRGGVIDVTLYVSCGITFALGIALYSFLSAKKKSYWQGQVSETITPSQITFDIIGGVVLPIVCLIFDPIVFHSGPRSTFLTKVQLLAYATIIIEIVTLTLWFTLKRFKQTSGFFAGVLMAGALTSFALGIVMLPLTLIGLIILIGILGLAPFVTSFIFFRNGYRAIQQAQQRDAVFWLTMVCGILFALGIPVLLQWQISAMITSSVEQIIYAVNETKAIQSAQTLNHFVNQIPIFTAWQTEQVTSELIDGMVQGKLAVPVFIGNNIKHLSWCSRCFDEIVWAYRSEKNPDKKALIAKIYFEATGEDIAVRVRVLEMYD